MNYRIVSVLLLVVLTFTDLRAQDPVMLLSFQDLLTVPEAVQQAAKQGHVPEHLASVHGKEVTVRGFLYRTTDGKYVLSAEPDLKSCCIGNTDKIARQIMVEGFADSQDVSGTAVAVQGRFSFSPLKDNKGTNSRLYLLENAVMVPESSGGLWPFFICAAALILAASVLCYFLRGRA